MKPSKHILKTLTCVIFCATIISSCDRFPFLNENPKKPYTPQDSLLEPSAVLKGEHPIAYIQKQQLFVIDPQYPQAAKVTDLEPKQLPVTTDIFEFKISPNKDYIVWYTPHLGFLKLNLDNRQIDVLADANDWLNRNPFFEFDNSGQLLHFVDKQGTEFVTINLSTNQRQDQQIPHPFGNVFKLSPDNTKILFIAAFGQSTSGSEFMFTDINLENPQRFTIQADLNQRFLTAWLSDSSGIVTVENGQSLVNVPFNNTNTKSTYFQLESDQIVTELRRVENLIYFFATDNRWRAVDTQTKDLVLRVPTEIAQEMYRPRFIPWYDKTFLIEEVYRLFPEQYYRLWLTTPLGVKKKIIDRYQEVTLTQDTPTL